MFAEYNDDHMYQVNHIDLGFGAMISENTLLQMKRIIRESTSNIDVINTARQIVAKLPAKDQYGEVDAIYNWVRNHTRYVKDPVGQELITTPPAALHTILVRREQFQGDCDCLTTLTLSLLRAIGYPVKIKATGYKGRPLSHVYGKVKIYDQWIPIEPIKLGVMLGWECPGATSTRELDV